MLEGADGANAMDTSEPMDTAAEPIAIANDMPAQLVPAFRPPHDWNTNYSTIKLDVKNIPYIFCTYRNTVGMHNHVLFHCTYRGNFFVGTAGGNGTMVWKQTFYDRSVWEPDS